MASELPTFPHLVFTILEPISLLAGAFPAILSPAWFISQQIDSPVPVSSTAQAELVAQQLGNCYFLAFLLGVAVLYSTTEIRVVRSYLFALWIADISHIAITMFGLGYGATMAPGSWNSMAWGNIGVTGFLFLTRSAYFIGVFGSDKPQLRSNGKKSQ
ncbi:hypothetical protein QBC34DRAFT_208741 [Podospora aff. communis PSN243]|uniref:DUF7704 domain-containing protein n=1 Tax=Podospora aff. communis PSN243 TaxID=3040156 RepID=A0AAV9GZ36_9PEZI|nr:hypothetical protein QBC34DRAFT_208741 [Podospora aff. communis PSN243]